MKDHIINTIKGQQTNEEGEILNNSICNNTKALLIKEKEKKEEKAAKQGNPYL
jgi:hypothetical protein